MQPPLIYVWIFLACLLGAFALGVLGWHFFHWYDRFTERGEFVEPDDDARILPATPKQARQIEQDEIELGNAYRE